MVPKDCTGEKEQLPNELNDGNGQSENDELDDSDGDEINTNKNSRNGVENECGDTFDTNERRPRMPTQAMSSANIPLMRIVQSVKHTKRRSGQVFKEGWLVHFTNKDKVFRRHYWRLDSKAITLYTSDHGSKYYKEIPLNEIISIETARNLAGNESHCFLIRVSNVDYFVGQDPLLTYKVGEPLILPPPDSGIGAHLAKSWETSIRQALMPVTSNRKFIFFVVETISSIIEC